MRNASRAIVPGLFVLFLMASGTAQDILIHPDEFSHYSHAAATSDGGALIVSSALELIRVDAAGAPIWQERLLPDPSINTTTQPRCLASPMGELLIYGPAFDTLAGSGFWITELDANGAHQWSRFYPMTPYVHDDMRVLVRQDGTLTMGITALIDSVERLVIAHLDVNGSPLSAHAYTPDSAGLAGSSIRDMASTLNGGILYCGTSDLLSHVMKLDASGVPLWSRTFESPTGSLLEPHALMETGDGGIAIGAHHYTGSGMFPDLNPVGLKFDGDGDLVWQKQYSPDVGAGFWNVHENAAGDLLFSGRNKVSVIVQCDAGGAPLYGAYIPVDPDALVQGFLIEVIAFDAAHIVRAGEYAVGDIDPEEHAYFQVLDADSAASCLLQPLVPTALPFAATQAGDQWSMDTTFLTSTAVPATVVSMSATTSDLCTILGITHPEGPRPEFSVHPTVLERHGSQQITLIMEDIREVTLLAADGRMVFHRELSAANEVVVDLGVDTSGCYVIRARSANGTSRVARILVR